MQPCLLVMEWEKTRGKRDGLGTTLALGLSETIPTLHSSLHVGIQYHYLRGGQSAIHCTLSSPAHCYLHLSYRYTSHGNDKPRQVIF